MISVAAYCRVSTDGEEQLNSFEAQKKYFADYVAMRSDWSLYDLYADRGISGTSAKNRTEFQRMLRDAGEGKFTLLLTKDVSRFARNILDAVAYTRELRKLGVGVIFLNDGICTTDADAELRLSILGSIAQEESRRTSQRVKWGQQRQMERGVVFGHSLLGYDCRDGVLSVEPHGADLVRRIFHGYTVEKLGSSSIAERLIQETGEKWTPGKVIRVLKNEKYVGDLLQKKTITPDFLTHERQINRGQEPMIYLQDHHPAIISRPLWEQTQHELQSRSRKRSYGQSCSYCYALSGKVICGQCGGILVARSKKRADASRCVRWCCTKTSCGMRKSLSDELAKKTVLELVHTLLPDMESFVYQTNIKICRGISAARTVAHVRITEERDRIDRQMERAVDLYCGGKLSSEEMERLRNRCLKRLTQLEIRQETKGADFTAQIWEVLRGRCSEKPFYRELVDQITVFPDRRAEIRLTGLNRGWIFDFQ